MIDAIGSTPAVRARTLFWCAVALGVSGGAAARQTLECQSLAGDATADPHLYCIDLVPTPDLDTASGTVRMVRRPGPFTTSVAPDGTPRYTLEIAVAGLPDPAALGSYSTYVAWATTPLLRPIVKLGEIGDGPVSLGPVAFDKFLVLVSAEATAEVETRSGRLVLRGMSASMRMLPDQHLMLGTAAPAAAASAAADWPMPPMHPAIPAVPALAGFVPELTPRLPGDAGAPTARPRELVTLGDGDTLDLEAGLVTRRIRGRTFTMYGFNGQYPGPLIHVPRRATVVVNFTNRIDLPTAVHWHGIRLDNRFDGVPGVTQDPVPPGGTFRYRIHFPDAGIYWYHPHHREDIQQDLGLYGNLLVQPDDPDYFGPAHREEVLMLDDLLVGPNGLVPYGADGATHALMGRFGNVFLVNGEPEYALAVRRGEVVRFFLTNVSNTRTFNLSFGGAAMKVVGSDVGKFERESWTESIVIAPAERYIVEVRFDEPGTVAFVNAVKSLNHFFGSFFPEVDTLGTIDVGPTAAEPDLGASFAVLRRHDDVTRDIDPYRRHFDRPVDRHLVLALETEGLPVPVEQMLRVDSVYFNPVEWTGTMRMMNWLSTTDQVRWVLREVDGARENMDIAWRFEVGDVIKLRLTNDRRSLHAMQHPIHIHGQRFLVLEQDGVPNDNLVWKDTILLPVGSTADVLLELSNPGRWMLHCHIAEHLESGMKMVFEVEGAGN